MTIIIHTAELNLMKSIKLYITLARIKNYLKNIFIFIPLVFSLKLFNWNKLLVTGIAFVAFCLISSAVYVFNDICDAKKDALHPVKCYRPIASGATSQQQATIFAVVLAIIGVTASLAVNLSVASLLAVYIALNLLYSMWLKHKPIFDCFCIAAGFIVRVYTGGAASGEPISNWLFLTIVAMSLFMAFGKRRGELVNLSSSKMREVLQHYNANFLDGIIFMCAGLAVVFYSLWSMSRGYGMIYTVPLIIFIMSKYLLLIYGSDSHGDPTTVIFSDKSLLIACGCYGLLTIILLYLGGKA